MAIWGNNILYDDDLSPSSTIVVSNPPIPVLRAPVPAEDPNAGGPFVLTFKSAASWRSALESTQSKLIDQCMAGARVGCAISASNKCKSLWWKSLFGASVADYAEREWCEEREIASCLEASKEPCIRFAREKCLPSFRDARIATSELTTYKGSFLLDKSSVDCEHDV